MQKSEEEIAAFVVHWLKTQLKKMDVPADSHFANLGLDSLDVVRLTDALAEKLGLDELPVDVVMDHPSIPKLAAHLAAR